ncbi:helix-turn-helix transcriptional regulator [Cupriavidus basilensis]
MGAAAPEQSSLPHGMALASAPLGGWLQQLQLVTSSPELLLRASENPGVARQLELLLLALLAVAHEGAVSLVRRGAPLPGFVKRAEAFITEHLAEKLQLEDISRAVGVAGRTLRDGFQQFKGTSPMQYLHAVRLERARQVLHSAPAAVRIADVALACGFRHLGRFSIAYKERFGESPSETLRKSRAI